MLLKLGILNSESLLTSDAHTHTNYISRTPLFELVRLNIPRLSFYSIDMFRSCTKSRDLATFK